MSDCIEVLFVSDDSGKLQTANIFNPHIGTTLMTYRGGGGASSKCLSVIGNDYLISADNGKPLLHVWPLNSQETSHELRTVVPGKPSALSVSPDGNYCIAGIDGKIYVWHVSSGSLLNVISRHYQKINKIIFTEDSSNFITAGEDGLVLVWKLADTAAKQFGDIYKLTNSQIQPHFNFSQHSLPVNDIFVSRGNLKARLYTCSADQTCKIFCLQSGSLLLSVIFEYVLTSITVNELETHLFVGTSSGKIQSFSLDPYPRTLEHHMSEETENNGTFSGHTNKITCLSTSFDGITLASGSEDEKVFLWNIPSRQLLRCFEMKGPITNLFFYSAPSNIFSNKIEPHVIVSKFEKASRLEDKNFEANVWVNETLKPISFSKDEESEENIKVSGKKSNENEDVTALKQQIFMLKEANKQLYQFAMSKIIKSPLAVGLENGNGV